MIRIKFKVQTSTGALRAFFGQCQLRVFLTNRSYVDIGRFSSCAIDRLRMYKNLEGEGCLATVGDFCEFADSEILLGGEHANDSVVNQVLSGCTVFQTLLERNGFLSRHRSRGRIDIGHGVIVSAGAKILSGTKIGPGAVIAAGALVRGEVPAFTICAGVPARPIKSRNVDQTASFEFWNMNLAQIFELTTGKKLPNEEAPYNRDYRLVIRMVSENDNEEGRFSGFEIIGIQAPDKFIQPHPKSVFMKYCSQVSLKKGEMAEWLSDPFSLDVRQ